MSTFSYSKPETSLPYTSIGTAPLYPLVHPGNPNDGPALPPAAAQRMRSEVAANIIPGYRLSTHMFRAASPRTKCSIGPTPTFPMDLPNRKQKVKTASAHLESLRSMKMRDEYEVGDSILENGLWVVVNRFVSEKLYLREKSATDTSGTTMVFMHAIGLHKETWEETMRAVILQLPGFNETVDELWLLDSVNHGDSALINEGKLGDIFSWHDNARDLLQFLLYYLPEKVGKTEPLHLNALSEQISKIRSRTGFTNRCIIGVGHSFGGTSLCRAAIDESNLFSDLLLVDPVIYPPSVYDAIVGKEAPLSSVVGRQAEFPSREAALGYYLKIPFFSKWDRRVLQNYVDFAFIENKEIGGIRLKMHSYQEGTVFAERRAAMETWELLDRLDDRIELRWIMNGTESGSSTVNNKETLSPWRRDVTVWRREANCSNVRIKGSGHLIAQTLPNALGREFGSYVLERYRKLPSFTARL